jgi:hypothetical protein
LTMRTAERDDHDLVAGSWYLVAGQGSFLIWPKNKGVSPLIIIKLCTLVAGMI